MPFATPFGRLGARQRYHGKRGGQSRSWPLHLASRWEKVCCVWIGREGPFEAKDKQAPPLQGIFRNHFLSCNIAFVKPFELLGETLSPDGTVMKLIRRDDEYLILADGAVLMTSRMHGSEEELATLACQRARTVERASVLVGGLGMGFTLRATLDLLSADATVVVAELVPAVVEWNRGPLGPLARDPLKDTRVRVEMGDVALILRSSREQFDAVLLDVDNGPAAFAASNNAGLYDERGVADARGALKSGGALAVWAVREDREFVERLRKGGFDVQVRRVRGRLKKGGPRHIIFVGHKT
jgi:spermidine synthase